MNLRIRANLRLVRCVAAVAGLGLGSVAMAQIRSETISSGLENPWGVTFLPGGRFVVTERSGRLRVIAADGKIGAPVSGLPAIAAGGQGGLLDVLADSAFEKNRTLYFCFSEPEAGGSANGTALARAQLSEDGAKLENLRIIFSQRPKVASRNHFGCRIVEARDGNLFLTLGDRFSRKEDAQKLDNHLGKIVRIAKDGTVPKDNPFVGKAARCLRSGATATATAKARRLRPTAVSG
jgi:glucose/arabinose dehydrogenase